jgi:uncharacterized membrane protein YfcA
MDLAFPVVGFLVGGLVGLTGIGGGSIMTPLLILLFGVHPLSAVGTDLLYAAITKGMGARIHAGKGNVEWRIVGWLALGSVPGTLATVLLLAHLPARSPALTHIVTVAIGVALVLAAAGLLFGQFAGRFAARFAKDRPARTSPAGPGLTVLLGLVLGVLVSLTSVGAGAIGIVVLRVLYPQLPAVRLVGSDIAHAVPLTLLAGSGHWLMGDVNWTLLGLLLMGSIPGIWLASLWAHRVPETILRRGLGVVLLTVAGPIIAS